MSPRFMEIISSPSPLRVGLRVPVHLFRLRLGWLLGGHVLLMAHSSRPGGHVGHVVLEIASYDPRSRCYLAVSGSGRRSRWFRDIQRNPEVTLRVGRQRLLAQARPLDAHHSGRAMMRYALLHPRTAKDIGLSRGLGAGTAADFYQIGHDHMAFTRLDLADEDSVQQRR